MTEREKLLAEAKELNLEFAKNAKTDTIRDAVTKAKEEKMEEEAFVAEGGSVEVEEKPKTMEEIKAEMQAEFDAKLQMEKAKMQANMEVNIAMKDDTAGEQRASLGQAKLKARKEALALVRVVITVKDPAKQGWDGEIISAGNDVIGEVKKYVDFVNTEGGYHLPRIIHNVMRDRMCTVFVNKKGKDGKTLKEAKQIKAFSFEYLEPLTPDELTELGRSQTDRNAID